MDVTARTADQMYQGTVSTCAADQSREAAAGMTIRALSAITHPRSESLTKRKGALNGSRDRADRTGSDTESEQIALFVRRRTENL